MKQLRQDYPVFTDGVALETFIFQVSGEMRMVDIFGRLYGLVGNFSTTTHDFDLGIPMICVIRRLSDGREYGLDWWDGLGEALVEPNSDVFDMRRGEDMGLDPDEPYCIFEPARSKYVLSYGLVE